MEIICYHSDIPTRARPGGQPNTKEETRMIKKITALFMVLVMVLAMTACTTTACGLPRRDRRNRGNACGERRRSARRLRRRPDAGLLRVRQPGRQRPHGCPERDQCLHRAADRCAYRVPDHLLRRLEPEGPDGPPVRREGRHLLHRRLAELRPLHFSGPVHPPQRRRRPQRQPAGAVRPGHPGKPEPRVHHRHPV